MNTPKKELIILINPDMSNEHLNKDHQFDPDENGNCYKCGIDQFSNEAKGEKMMRTCVVYRTKAQALKPEYEKSNYNATDQVQFEACQFSDGAVAQRWLTTTGSMVWWPNWEALCNVHIYVHPDYGTRVEWSDGEINEL